MDNQFEEMRALLPNVEFRTIFDIGANIGQSSQEYRRKFSRATIYAFEPTESTFALLQKNMAEDTRTKCFQLAFGDRRCFATIKISRRSVSNRILEAEADVLDGAVRVEVGDTFCADQNISRINFLKIDTEGYDLRVCRGFQGMLSAQKIDLVQVESGLDPRNKLHVPFATFKEFLEPLGYYIFRIYEQAGAPVARRCNIVFISALQAQNNLSAKKTRNIQLGGL